MSIRRSTHIKSRTTARASILGRLLDPIDRLSETIYSVLILLTFTLAYRIIALGDAPDMSASPAYATELLVASLGAILAWGLIDGVMYVGHPSARRDSPLVKRKKRVFFPIFWPEAKKLGKRKSSTTLPEANHVLWMLKRPL